jgi:hypothetical protein
MVAAMKVLALCMCFARRIVLLFLQVGTFATAGQAVTLDWDGVTWNPGSVSNSYDVDSGHLGNDITVGATFTTDRFANDPATGSASPSINDSLSGGLASGPSTLKFVVDYSTRLETITITIDFTAFYPQGVENVSFSIFNIDSDFGGPTIKWQDQITAISATDGTTTFAPSIAGVGSSVTHSGTGLGQTLTGMNTVPDSGAGSGAGNATISFGSTPITSLTFTFASGPDAKNNPDLQYIGLYDITFTPVPELNPAWSALGSCLVAAALILRHSAKFRK